MNTKPGKNRKLSRAERMRDLQIRFPEPKEPAPPATDAGQPEETVNVTTENYPRLRVWLRDRDLSFKPSFDQGDVALVICKSDKTVRSRTRKRQIPCHCWPWGEVYYTAQDLENLLASCESGRTGVK